MAQVILPVTLVRIAARHNHLADAVLQAFRYATVVDSTDDLADLCLGLFEELVPVVRDSFGQLFRNLYLAGLSREVMRVALGLLLLCPILVLLKYVQS